MLCDPDLWRYAAIFLLGCFVGASLIGNTINDPAATNEHPRPHFRGRGR
jgi:hypothetical protein